MYKQILVIIQQQLKPVIINDRYQDWVRTFLHLVEIQTIFDRQVLRKLVWLFPEKHTSALLLQNLVWTAERETTVKRSYMQQIQTESWLSFLTENLKLFKKRNAFFSCTLQECSIGQ